MQPDPAHVRSWLKKADHDIRIAEAALALEQPVTDAAGFHCQQAVEKLLKAYLVSRGRTFEKIHDLEVLTDLCAECDDAFRSLVDQVEPLTSFAVQFRYPGPDDPLVDEVSEALMIVRRVWDFVLSRLPTDARWPP